MNNILGQMNNRIKLTEEWQITQIIILLCLAATPDGETLRMG
jgi:hypothetical protein